MRPILFQRAGLLRIFEVLNIRKEGSTEYHFRNSVFEAVPQERQRFLSTERWIPRGFRTETIREGTESRRSSCPVVSPPDLPRGFVFSESTSKREKLTVKRRRHDPDSFKEQPRELQYDSPPLTRHRPAPLSHTKIIRKIYVLLSVDER